jgi:hypothetical protein
LELFLHLRGRSRFLHDGGPCHKARIVAQQFDEWLLIQLIKRPGNSSDLNLIEKVLVRVKFKLRETSCSNMQEWKREIVTLWVTRMSDSYCLEKLVESMLRRLAKVTENEKAPLDTSIN